MSQVLKVPNLGDFLKHFFLDRSVGKAWFASRSLLQGDERGEALESVLLRSHVKSFG